MQEKQIHNKLTFVFLNKRSTSLQYTKTRNERFVTENRVVSRHLPFFLLPNIIFRPRGRQLLFSRPPVVIPHFRLLRWDDDAAAAHVRPTLQRAAHPRKPATNTSLLRAEVNGRRVRGKRLWSKVVAKDSPNPTRLQIQWTVNVQLDDHTDEHLLHGKDYGGATENH